MHSNSGALGSVDSETRALRAEPRMMGVSSPGEAVEVEQLADFHLDELEELLIVDLVALVEEDEDGRNVDLTGEQKVLTGLEP